MVPHGEEYLHDEPTAQQLTGEQLHATASAHPRSVTPSGGDNHTHTYVHGTHADLATGARGSSEPMARLSPSIVGVNDTPRSVSPSSGVGAVGPHASVLSALLGVPDTPRLPPAGR